MHVFRLFSERDRNRVPELIFPVGPFLLLRFHSSMLGRQRRLAVAERSRITLMSLEDPNSSVSMNDRQLSTRTCSFVAANFGTLKLSTDNDRLMTRGRDFILRLSSAVDLLTFSLEHSCRGALKLSADNDRLMT